MASENASSRTSATNSPEYRRHSYLTRGLYADQLQAWLRVFDRKQLLVIKSEDYFAAPDTTLRDVFAFLELPPWAPPAYARKNVGTYKSPLDPQLRRRLVEHFAPHNTGACTIFWVSTSGWD